MTLLVPILRFEAGTRPRDRTLNPFRVQAPEVIAWVEARDPLAVDRWDEVGRAEYGRAFTAARTAGHDVIDDLYFAFADTIARGGTEADFSRLVRPILREKGWLADQSEAHVGRRLALIYEMNLRFARASGRWARYQTTKHVLPYLRGITARDERVRHPPKSRADHTAWEGIRLPIDHWFWTRYFPPLGFKCRCGTVQMSRSQFLKLGGQTSDAELAERMARLGPPVFPSPAVPIEAQLAEMVEESNRSPMPGNPPIEVRPLLASGSALFSSIMSDLAWAGVDELLRGLFGGSAEAA